MKNTSNYIYLFLIAVGIFGLYWPMIIVFKHYDQFFNSINAVWFLLFSSLFLLALITSYTVLMFQKEKHRFEEKKREDENSITILKEKLESERMKVSSMFRQTMEKYEKVNSAISEQTSLLKNSNTNTWPTKDQILQIIEYMKVYETTFEQMMQKLNNNENNEKK